jgi:multicomponent Na+:H+ antiporter subunit E
VYEARTYEKRDKLKEFLMHPLLIFTPTLLAYLGLTANFEIANLILGSLIAGGITALVRPEPGTINIRRTINFLWSLLQYLAILAFDLVKSGIIVARIVLSPSLPIRPGIVAIPTEVRGDWAVALNAHALTLTPGEMVVEIDQQGIMYTHCLDATHAEEYILEAQELRQKLLKNIAD